MASTTGRGSSEAVSSRRRRLVEEVTRRGTVSVEDLIEDSGASATTVYRDLAALEESGLVQRRWGQVTAVAGVPSEAGAAFRVSEHVEAKKELAAHVAATGLVEPGQTLMIDDSTSSLWLVRALREVSPLTVVTNSLLVAREVEDAGGARLFVVGGAYRPWAQALLGHTTVRAVEELHADLCVMSASGIAGGHCYHPHEDIIAVKRAMMRSSDRAVLLLDHSKLDRRALHSFARLEDFDVVVVDSGTTAAQREALAAAGARLQLASPL